MNTHPFNNTRYADAGASGMPVVVLHGFTERLELWQHCQRELAHTNRVLALDMLGHGMNTHHTDFTILDMARQVAALLDYLHIPKALWVGHSMGGYAALQAVKHLPERVAGLCLFHSMPFADTDEGRAARAVNIAFVREGKKEQVINGLAEKTFALHSRQEKKEMVESVRLQRLQTPDEGMIAALQAMCEREDTTDVLRQFPKPVMMLLGAEDPIVPMPRMLELLPTLHLGMACVLREAAHMGMIEAPEASIHALRAFIALCGES